MSGFYLYDAFTCSNRVTYFYCFRLRKHLYFLLVCLRPYLFPKQKFFARPVITNFETQMFIRLKQSFPNYHVLAQVAFSALITSNNYKIRSQFNRKVTDFVAQRQDGSHGHH